MYQVHARTVNTVTGHPYGNAEIEALVPTLVAPLRFTAASCIYSLDPMKGSYQTSKSPKATALATLSLLDSITPLTDEPGCADAKGDIKNAITDLSN
jgi:hypothetical protein